MNDLDDLKSSFSSKLDRRIEQHEARTGREIETLHGRRQAEPAKRPPAAAPEFQTVPPMPVNALVNMRTASPLDEIDRYFSQTFDLPRYYPENRLDYPTTYCETLDEFFAPLLESFDLSPQTRQAELEGMIAQARAGAQSGGMFGYNLSGRGCYINGWLFSYSSKLTPRQMLQDPRGLPLILETAAHEKLGHGFLDAYSALGAVKASLDLEQVEIARKFGLHTADTPLSSLHTKQHNLLHAVSQLLEEGWATWIESFLAAAALQAGPHPKYDRKRVFRAIRSLPRRAASRERNILLEAWDILFEQKTASDPALHQAVMVVDTLGPQFDAHFGDHLGQPLIYAVGELLVSQAEASLGPLCVPYAVLIAANVTFDPQQIGLIDLQVLLESDPRLHPDARLAALGRLKLDNPDDVGELVRRAEAELNFSVPPELKRRT